MCDQGAIRLVGGASSLEGRVEICRNSAWGTVCDSGWNTPDATVVCRQLGLSTAGAVSTAGASFGQGTGLVHYVNVNCAGTESRLVDCSRGSVIACSHARDAGVRCNARTSKTMTPATLKFMYIHDKSRLQ